MICSILQKRNLSKSPKIPRRTELNPTLSFSATGESSLAGSGCPTGGAAAAWSRGPDAVGPRGGGAAGTTPASCAGEEAMVEAAAFLSDYHFDSPVHHFGPGGRDAHHSHAVLSLYDVDRWHGRVTSICLGLLDAFHAVPLF